MKTWRRPSHNENFTKPSTKKAQRFQLSFFFLKKIQQLKKLIKNIEKENQTQLNISYVTIKRHPLKLDFVSPL